MGQKITNARNSVRVIGFAGASVSRIYTSSRRAIYALQNSIPPAAQWDKISFSAFDDEVRKLIMEEEPHIDYEDHVTLQRLLNGFEWVVNATFEHWKRWVISDSRIFNDFIKALKWIGIEVKFENDRFMTKNISLL